MPDVLNSRPIFVHENIVYVTENDKPLNDSDVAIYPVTDGTDMSWRWEKNKVKNEPYNIIVVNNNNQYSLYKKQRPEIGDIPSKKPKSVLYKPEYSSGNGTSEIKSLFNGIRVFSHPKPLCLIKDLIQIICGNDQNAIIMDFFAGSGTTAHAIFDLNDNELSNRSWICIQFPEIIDETDTDDSNKQVIAFLDSISKPHTISEITQERIRRAGQLYKNNNKLVQTDVGFRFFKIDSSNMNDVFYDSKTLKKDILDYVVDNIKSDRSCEDLLFQVMLELGIELSSSIVKECISNKEVFIVDDGYLIACFDQDINDDLVTNIAKHKPYYAVFRDSSLSSDDVAINFSEIFNTYSPSTKTKVL